MSVLKPIGRWLIGFLFGTLMVGITSPLFVRSYVGRTMDPIRQVVTYPAGASYRWRSEGYATTVVGPHGMPGQTQLADDSVSLRVALYGDSQVEGVAVPDDQKLFALLQDRLQDSVVYPLARSGETASDWLPQMRRVEVGLGVDMHVIVVVDLADLLAAAAPHREVSAAEMQMPNQLDGLPDFVVHAASRLLRDPSTGETRRLRWGVGPVDSGADNGAVSATNVSTSANIDTTWLSSLKTATDKRMLVVFAPRMPEILDGSVRYEASDRERRRMQNALTKGGIDWIDTGKDFVTAAKAGDWPHGFQNGQWGAGHLNETGYQILADGIATWIGKGE